MFTSCLRTYKYLNGDMKPGTQFPLTWTNIKERHTLGRYNMGTHSSKVFIKLNNILSVFNIHSPHIYKILQSKYMTEDHKPSHIYYDILSRRDIFKVLNFHQIWDDLHIYTLIHV